MPVRGHCGSAKFGEVASDARERGKQARFLASRGFAADLVRRIVGGLDES